MQMLMRRLKEPSSWASLAAILALFGVNMPDSFWQDMSQVGVGVAGIVGLMMADPGNK